ncbi:MAG: hypothetical protein J0I12_30180 [Candidatus Eremiobacteraeota bacterium]|nr:hypothetical protein [Candidatus Eremiobacteraeota bacterium]
MRTIACLLLLAAPLAAKPQVQARLLCDKTALVPGQTIRLGVLLEPGAHWHTYWKNAGDSGLPSEFTWKLPAGWQPGALLWPLPGRFEAMGSVLYGYDQPALHQISVRVPADLKQGQNLKLGVHASWLACNEETCVPGQADLTLSLPVAANSKASASKPLFDEQQEPEPIPSEVTRAGQELVLKTKFTDQLTTFFPDPGLQIVDAAPQKADGAGLHLQAAARSKPLTRLQGLLVVGEGKSRRGYTVDQAIP